MLKSARVKIPSPVVNRLQSLADFTADNVNVYARDDLFGFKRPIAAVFALVAPLCVALVFRGSGAMATLETALLLIGVLLGGLLYVGRIEWPNIVSAFQEKAIAKRRAVADLKCGFGEATFLNSARAPAYFEYGHGVVVLADAGEFKTLFFDIAASDDDPRWALYAEGELDRRIWRWLRLPVSREVVKFATEGSKHDHCARADFIESIEVYEAINLTLGEPLDGAVIHRPFAELVAAVSKAL